MWSLRFPTEWIANNKINWKYFKPVTTMYSRLTVCSCSIVPMPDLVCKWHNRTSKTSDCKVATWWVHIKTHILRIAVNTKLETWKPLHIYRLPLRQRQGHKCMRTGSSFVFILRSIDTRLSKRNSTRSASRRPDGGGVERYQVHKPVRSTLTITTEAQQPVVRDEIWQTNGCSIIL